MGYPSILSRDNTARRLEPQSLTPPRRDFKDSLWCLWRWCNHLNTLEISPPLQAARAHPALGQQHSLSMQVLFIIIYPIHTHIYHYGFLDSTAGTFRYYLTGPGSGPRQEGDTPHVCLGALVTGWFYCMNVNSLSMSMTRWGAPVPPLAPGS